MILLLVSNTVTFVCASTREYNDASPTRRRDVSVMVGSRGEGWKRVRVYMEVERLK